MADQINAAAEYEDGRHGPEHQNWHCRGSLVCRANLDGLYARLGFGPSFVDGVAANDRSRSRRWPGLRNRAFLRLHVLNNVE